ACPRTRLCSIPSRSSLSRACSLLFFFNDTATTEIYTLSLHDALPIYRVRDRQLAVDDVDDHLQHRGDDAAAAGRAGDEKRHARRSEEHTSELQSLTNLVCRLLLEKKKKE